MMRRLSMVIDCARPCRWLDKLTATDSSVLQAKDQAAERMIGAAENAKRYIEDRRITLIIESAEEMREGFTERRRKQ